MTPDEVVLGVMVSAALVAFFVNMFIPIVKNPWRR